MHRTTGANNSSNMFTDGPPGTVIEQGWLNDVQETIIDPITTAGISLVAGTYTQLTSAITALARTAVRTAAQIFNLGITVNQSTTNGDAINAYGNGSGRGVYAEGTTGAAIEGFATGAVALKASRSATNVDVARLDGYVDLSNGAQPSATTAFSNRATKKNITKAWGALTFLGNDVGNTRPAGTAATISNGFNVASATVQAGYVEVTFASAFSGQYEYSVQASLQDGTPPVARHVMPDHISTTVVRLYLFDASGTAIDPSTGVISPASYHLQFTAHGAQ